MVVDLELGLDTHAVNVLEWVPIDSVVMPEGITAKGLAEMLRNMPVAYPSSAFGDEGFLWDYKDTAAHNFNVLSQVAEAIEGVSITNQSEGPKYWFIAFEYKGKIAGVGPGYDNGQW